MLRKMAHSKIFCEAYLIFYPERYMKFKQKLTDQIDIYKTQAKPKAAPLSL